MKKLSTLTLFILFTSISYSQDLFTYSIEEFKADSESQKTSFCVVNDSLYAVSDLKRAHIEIINKNTGETVRKIGKRGRGPGEIGRINFFTYDKVNQVFTVFDSGGFSIKRFNLNGEVIDEKLLPKDQVFMPYYGHQIDEDNLYIFAYNYTNENILHQYSISKNEYVESFINFEEITSLIDNEVIKDFYVGGFDPVKYTYPTSNTIFFTTSIKDNFIYNFDKEANSIKRIHLPNILNMPNKTVVNPKNDEGFQIRNGKNRYAYKSYEHVIGLTTVDNKLLCFIQLDDKNNYPNNIGVHLYNIEDTQNPIYIGYESIEDLNVNLNRVTLGRYPQYILHKSDHNRLYFLKYGETYNSIVELTLHFRD